MAKFSRADDETQDLVHQIAAELGLEQFMDFEALYVPKAKEVVAVQKASKLAEYLSNRDDLILIVIFQEVFDQFEEKDKYMTLRMAMDAISFDSEKDKITIGCPMITVPLGYYEQVGKPAVDCARLGLHSIAQWEEKKKQEKERQKEEKKSKKKKKSEF